MRHRRHRQHSLVDTRGPAENLFGVRSTLRWLAGSVTLAFLASTSWIYATQSGWEVGYVVGFFLLAASIAFALVTVDLVFAGVVRDRRLEGADVLHNLEERVRRLEEELRSRSIA